MSKMQSELRLIGCCETLAKKGTELKLERRCTSGPRGCLEDNETDTNQRLKPMRVHVAYTATAPNKGELCRGKEVAFQQPPKINSHYRQTPP